MATLETLARSVVDTRLRLNSRFLLGMAVVLVVFGGAVFGVHRYQAKKLVEAYATQADLAKDKGEVGKEVDYLRRYLSLNPADAGRRVRFGLLQARTAKRPQDKVAAYYTLQDGLRLDPTIGADVRLQAVKLAMDSSVRLPGDAQNDLDQLLKTDPTNAEYEMLYGDCRAMVADFAGADEWYSRSITHQKTNVPAYARQALVRRSYLKQPGKAAETVEAMLVANPEVAAAHVVAAEHFRAMNQTEEYAKAVAKAKALAPDDTEVVFTIADFAIARAETARRAGDPAARAAALDEVLGLLAGVVKALTPKMPPDDAPAEPDSEAARAAAGVKAAYHALVETAVSAGKLELAEDWAKKQMAALPNSAVARLDWADVLLSRQKYDEVEPVLAELTRLGVAPGFVNFHRGRLLAGRKQWAEAARSLETAVLGLADGPQPVARKANLLLALCYREAGELDRAFEAFQRAAPVDPADPGWLTAVQGMADTLARLGRPADAIVQYNRLVPVASGAAAPLARLRLGELLRRPPEQRDPAAWAVVEQDIQRVPAGVEADLLAAELAAARPDLAAARQTLAAAAGRHPTSAAVWQMRVLVELADDKPDPAAALVQQAVAKLGDTVDARLLRLRLAVQNGSKADELTKLAADIDKFPTGDRRRLLLALAAVAQQADRRDQARPWLERAARENPDDLTVQFARFDLALLDKDRPAADAVVDRVVQTTGSADTVPSKVIKAFALLDRANAGDAGKLAEAAALLVGLERQRTGWSRLYLAQARVADLQGDLSTAAAKYRKAVELGERNPAIVGRLLDLNLRTKQFAEADQVVQLTSVAGTLLEQAGGQDAGQLRANLAVASKDYLRAVELADKAVPETSPEPDKLMWLARIRALAGQLARAEKPVRRAVELAPARADAHVALVQMLVALKKPPAEVAAAVAAAEKGIPAAPLALAQCYEFVGRVADAQKLYDQAAAPAAAPAAVLRAAADFRLRQGNSAGARELLERLVAAPGLAKAEEEAARRMLARVLTSDPRPGMADKALAVLKLKSVDEAATLTGQETPDDLRVRANVLSQMPGRKPRVEARKLLEELANRGPLTTEDQYLLGQLLEVLGDWQKARPRFEAAAKAKDGTRPMIVGYAFALLRNNDAAGAREWVEKVVSAAPDDPAVAELKCRLAVGEGNLDAAVAVAQGLADAAKRPELGGKLLEAAGLPARAEPFYRRAASGGTAAGRLGLASYLARVNRLADAWAEFEAVWDQLPAAVVVPAACEAALQAGAGEGAGPVLEKIQARVAAAAAKDPALEVFVAILQSLTGDHAGSAALSRRVLDRNPENVLALNNLAYLTALQAKQPKEALGLIRRATAAAGPVPELLDTEGLILIAGDDFNQAAERLADSVVDSPKAMTYFHLAHAHYLAGRPLEAKLMLAEARKRNLRPADFHPLERPTVLDIEAKIDRR